jgi:signal transduction histidine kinase
MTNRRPRTVLAAAFALLAILLGLFAYALLRANANEREDAENRFQDKAVVSAALTESIFKSSSQQAGTIYGEKFSGPAIDAKLLDQQSQGVAYSGILDKQGNVLGTTTATSPAIRGYLGPKQEVVAAVMKGAPFALSNFQPAGSPAAGLIEYAAPFLISKTDFRIVVSGFDQTLISQFISAYLSDIPDSSRAHAFVVDEKGLVVGSPVKGQKAGQKVAEAGLPSALKGMSGKGEFDSGGTERAFTAAQVKNTPWRVVLTIPTAALYSGTSTTIEWLILISLGLAGLAAVFLLSRMIKAAAAVAEANEELEASNENLAHSNLELQRSNAELEQFASVASHDLQEPLRKVQTFGDQIERRFGEQMPEEAIDYLRRMRNSANRMSTLIEDLLRFSRVTTHAKPPVKLDLTEVAREVTSDLDALLQETHGKVEIGKLPTVQADPLQMRQLLQNLIANAVKFHRPGISPEVEVREVRAAKPGYASFTVSDNGIGFEDEYAERIFRVFERLHPRDVYEGTGIGLALCRKIVERHGGTISSTSVPDEGSTFTVTMPVSQAAPLGNGTAAGPVTEREPVHA